MGNQCCASATSTITESEKTGEASVFEEAKPNVIDNVENDVQMSSPAEATEPLQAASVVDPPQALVLQKPEVKCRSCGNTGKDFMGNFCTCEYGKALQEKLAAEAQPAVAEAVDTGAVKNAEGAAATEDLPFQDKMYQSSVAKVASPPPTIPGSMPRRPSSENITLDAYTKKYAAGFDHVLALEKPDGWVLKKEENGVKAYTKSVAGQPLLYFKGVSTFSCKDGPFELLNFILKTEDRPKWDEVCKKATTPQYFPPFYKYAYVQLATLMGVISARDLVTLGRLRFEEDGAITVALSSVEMPDHPESPGIVRINFIEGGYVIRPTAKEHEFEVTWTGLVDPKGWLPVWVCNLVVTKQALTLAKIKAFMAKSS